MSQVELERLIEWLSPQLINAQLQEVYAHERGLVLGMYSSLSFWLILDLQTQNPFIAYVTSEKSPWPKTKLARPASLFLNSHAKNLYLAEISVRTELGRVVVISFQNKVKSCDVEMQLVPRRANLKVSSEGKSISWLPWKDLDQQTDESPAEEKDFRGPDQLLQEWFHSQRKPETKSTPIGREVEGLKKDLRKKAKATEEIENKIVKNQSDSTTLYRLGEELKSRPLESFKGTELDSFLDFKRSVGWNREHCFTLAKTHLKKNEGARQRLEVLKKEIYFLEEKIRKVESGELGPDLFGNAKPNLEPKKHKISSIDENVKSRKKTLHSGAVVYMGKSARDNLALLRRARAWDFWLHLRDYPGAHAIIHREKNQNISHNELQEVARWLAEESLSSKALHNGAQLGVVIAEVRFVRPIKGDKAGRVNYHSEKILKFTYEK